MKTKNIYLFLVTAGLAGVLLSGCSKADLPESTATLSTLTADDSFTWNTAAPVAISITGLPTVIPVRSTLTISLENGSALFTRLHRMDENLNLSLVIPDHEKKLVLKYGSASYTLEIQKNRADFSFIPVVVD